MRMMDILSMTISYLFQKKPLKKRLKKPLQKKLQKGLPVFNENDDDILSISKKASQEEIKKTSPEEIIKEASCVQ